MYRIVGGTDMAFLRAIIVAFIVVGILDLLTKRTSKKTDSIDKFVVRAPIDFAALGAIGMVVVIGILIFCEIDGTVIPELVMVIFFMVGIFPGFLLMIAPIKGVWDVIVDDDDITVVKAFVYRRHWKFSKITYGKMKRGGMKVYVEGRARKAFFVDGMGENFSNFMERMEKEGKEVIYPEGMEPYTEEEMDAEEEQAED